MEPLLDLVAVAYEARAETQRFLESLVHIDVPYRLLIIDNNSPDQGVRDTIFEHLPVMGQGMCQSAGYIFNADNLGYARAVNQGMHELGSHLGASPAPYAAILNADTEFIEGQSIRAIIELFDQDPSIGIVGPRTIDSNGKLTHGGIITTPQHPRNHHRGWMQQDSPVFHDQFDVNTVSGATYFVDRAMWDELTDCEVYQAVSKGAPGAFLPTPHFFEETFCSYHARHHDWRVVYMGSVAMIHQWHRSTPVGSKDFKVPRQMFIDACTACGISLEGELD